MYEAHYYTEDVAMYRLSDSRSWTSCLAVKIRSRCGSTVTEWSFENALNVSAFAANVTVPLLHLLAVQDLIFGNVLGRPFDCNSRCTRKHARRLSVTPPIVGIENHLLYKF